MSSVPPDAAPRRWFQLQARAEDLVRIHRDAEVLGWPGSAWVTVIPVAWIGVGLLDPSDSLPLFGSC